MTEFNFHKNVLNFNNIKVEFEFSIEKICSIKKTIIVLLDPRSDKKNWGQFPNLFGVNLLGKIIWRAELPTTDTGDSYYKIKIEAGKLIAYSTCSYYCIIDPESGKIIEKIFTK